MKTSVKLLAALAVVGIAATAQAGPYPGSLPVNPSFTTVQAATFTATSRFRAGNGDVNAPSYSMTSLSSWGWYTDGTYWIFSADGVRSALVDSMGRWAFGTAAPSTTFGPRIHAQDGRTGVSGAVLVENNTGSANANAIIQLRSAAGGGGTWLRFDPLENNARWTLGALDANNFYLSLGSLGTGTNYIRVSTSGFTTPQATHVSARATANQTISTGADTKLNFGTEEVDTLGEWDATASSFTAINSGFYCSDVSTLWAANSTGQRWLALLLNNAVVTASMIPATSATVSQSQSIGTWCGDMAAGDKLHVHVNQTSGGNLQTQVTHTSVRISIRRIP